MNFILWPFDIWEKRSFSVSRGIPRYGCRRGDSTLRCHEEKVLKTNNYSVYGYYICSQIYRKRYV